MNVSFRNEQILLDKSHIFDKLLFFDFNLFVLSFLVGMVHIGRIRVHSLISSEISKGGVGMGGGWPSDIVAFVLYFSTLLVKILSPALAGLDFP